VPIRGCARRGIAGLADAAFGIAEFATTGPGTVALAAAGFTGDAIADPGLVAGGLSVNEFAPGGFATGARAGAAGASGGAAGAGAAGAGAAAPGWDEATDPAAAGMAADAFAGFAWARIVLRVDTGSAAAPAPTSQEIPRLWQFSHAAVVGMCVVGLFRTPANLAPS
jgi:hypothetical protein